MIKNRNKIILFLVVICLLVGSFLLINNKDIKVKSISSKSKKYNAVNPNDGYKNTSAQCDFYFDNIENQFISYKDVVGNDRNLFIVNHCAWDPYDIASGNFSNFNEEDKKNVCDMQKEFIENKQISYSNAVNLYNKSNCKGISGELTVSYDGMNCNDLKKEIQNDYVTRYGDYVNYYVDNCKSEVGDIDKSKLKPYKTDDSCESLKLVNSVGELYTGILEKNATMYDAKNQCNYSLYYINGDTYDFKNFLNNVNDDIKKNACNDMKLTIENHAAKSEDEKTYSEKCVNITGAIDNIVTKYITFDATTGYGIECSGNAVSNGVCRYSFKYNSDNNQVENKTITLPDVTTTNNGSGLYEMETGNKFSYWSKNNNCSTKDIMRGTTSLNINSLNYEGTYYACYSDDSSNTVENMTNIYKTCDVANDYQPTLTSTIKNTDDYSTDSDDNQSITKSEKTYTINTYCPMKCTETFTYTYPSIFETVKSGTYFELIYTPQVKSTYKCTQTFNYDLWKTSYNTAIDNEKKAYVDYQNAEGISSLSLSESDAGTSNTCTYRDEEGDTHYYSYYTLSFTPQKYDSSNGLISSDDTKKATFCNENRNNINSILSSLKSSLFDQIYQQLDSTKKLSEISNDTDSSYEDQIGKRKKLENMNKTCYDTLSTSTVSTEKFYSVKPNVSIKYDLDTTMDNEVTLTTTTDNPYYSDDDLDRKDVTEEYNISYGSTNLKFNAYTFGDDHITTRTKKVNYEFHTNFNYYSNFYTGSINNESNGIYLGNVFPVRLASSGKRNISFIMDTSNNSTLSGNVRSKLSEGNNNTYKCTYNISNDAVVLDDESKRDNKDEDKKDYKTTFFVRPVATNDVDPNNRLDKGLLGANWASKKGQVLIKIIEDKSKNNNTYNPNNLEYSFTLNANTLDQIRKYNKTKGSYDNVDWSESCNNLGMECESKFLNELLKGTYSNVNGSISNGRNARKYYIGGKWYSTDSLLSSKDFVEVSSGTKHSKNEVYGVCNSSCVTNKNASACYECLYKKVNEGVLP